VNRSYSSAGIRAFSLGLAWTAALCCAPPFLIACQSLSTIGGDDGKENSAEQEPFKLKGNMFYGLSFAEHNELHARVQKRGIDESSGCPFVTYADPKQIFDFISMTECNGNLVKLILIKMNGSTGSAFQSTWDKIYEDMPKGLVSGIAYEGGISIRVEAVRTEEDWKREYSKHTAHCGHRDESPCKPLQLVVNNVISSISLSKAEKVMADVTTYIYLDQVELHKQQTKALFDK
jgi:hypothetical protein